MPFKNFSGQCWHKWNVCLEWIHWNEQCVLSHGNEASLPTLAPFYYVIRDAVETCFTILILIFWRVCIDEERLQILKQTFFRKLKRQRERATVTSYSQCSVKRSVIMVCAIAHAIYAIFTSSNSLFCIVWCRPKTMINCVRLSKNTCHSSTTEGKNSQKIILCIKKMKPVWCINLMQKCVISVPLVAPNSTAKIMTIFKAVFSNTSSPYVYHFSINQIYTSTS